MDLTDLKALKSFLYAHNIRPDKRLGQNFLIDKNALEKLLEAAKISKDDTILEVGAGIGTITIELAKLAKKVAAVERDRALIPILEKVTKDCKNVEIVQEDILKACFMLHDSCFMVVGNIPYYLTAPLIRKFLESPNPPSSMTLMVQKEMAERICAKPPDMSILAVSVQVYAKPEIMAHIPRSSFWPTPKVDSAILRIISNSPHPPLTVRGGAEGGVTFFDVVRAGFSSPRKQLINNLPKELLLAADIAPERRAETLTVEEWERLWYNTL